MKRFTQALRAVRQLGLRQTGNFMVYRLGLESGWLHLITRKAPRIDPRLRLEVPLSVLPERAALLAVLGENGGKALLAEANEILRGEVRLFGGPPVPLNLDHPGPRLHWTRHERGTGKEHLPAPGDIKLVWEPARFGWAITLGRAYLVSGDERLANFFWERTETFLQENPAYEGWHWTSAQEVALRLIALSFAGGIFRNSEQATERRNNLLARAIAEHAGRIPPTIYYARAQNNNHLLSEAAGLYTAGLALPEHPHAKRWRRLGRAWFESGIAEQITADGTYCQHSANYHRLMLQLALWMHTLSRNAGEEFSATTQKKLAAATQWLNNLTDANNGLAPNLGPNDGANLFALSGIRFGDHRPTLQAAGVTFLGEQLFRPGVWDELGVWLGAKDGLRAPPARVNTQHTTPHILNKTGQKSRAYLRATQFTARPGHADQLHLDLWLGEVNLALDAGTYLYNAQPPWNNALAGTGVHNTVMVNSQDQMTPAGKFLFLDWAQAKITEARASTNGRWEKLVAQHNGYARLGVMYRRTVEAQENERWVVIDELLPVGRGQTNRYTARLHWLLGDFPWAMEHNGANSCVLRLELNGGTGCVSVRVDEDLPAIDYRLYYKGVKKFGSGEEQEILGWWSPTYNVRLPALSLGVTAVAPLPLRFETVFELGNLRT